MGCSSIFFPTFFGGSDDGLLILLWFRPIKYENRFNIGTNFDFSSRAHDTCRLGPFSIILYYGPNGPGHKKERSMSDLEHQNKTYQVQGPLTLVTK